MPYIPPEVVMRAREMDLLTYLQTYEPQELVHFGGGTYCTREHDSLKISNGKFCPGYETAERKGAASAAGQPQRHPRCRILAPQRNRL